MLERFDIPDQPVWLKWTLLYGLGCLGGIAVAQAWGVLDAQVPLVLGLAFLIGLGFPSWWWVLGPPAAVLVPLGVVFVVGGGNVALAMIIFVVPLVVGGLALVAAAGVGIGKWWRERRRSDSVWH